MKIDLEFRALTMVRALIEEDLWQANNAPIVDFKSLTSLKFHPGLVHVLWEIKKTHLTKGVASESKLDVIDSFITWYYDVC